MDNEFQIILLGLMVGSLLPHSFLVFIETFTKGTSQYGDMLEIEISSLRKKMKFYELLEKKLFSSRTKDYTFNSLIRAYWGLKFLRVFGFIPFILFLFLGLFLLAQNIFVDQIDFGNLYMILFGVIFVFEVIIIVIRVSLEIPTVLINLNSKYENKTYLFVLFSIFPFWKKN